MRATLWAAVIAAGVAGGPVLAAAPACDGGSVSVTGHVRGLGVLQTEPQETPQSSFFLESTDFSCTQDAILVMAPGVVACSNGDRAVVVGDYLPSGGVSDTPIIDGARVTCSAP